MIGEVITTKEWTDARYKQFVVAVLRSGTRRYPPKYECLNAAKVGKRINRKTGRLAEHYHCASCECDFPAKEVQVNHIFPVVPIGGFTTWDDYISRLFCEQEALEVVCIPCHKTITKEENRLRKEFIRPEQFATYQSWSDMKQRCFNSKDDRYYTHGARGITVCTDWKNSFDSFINDMGWKPEGHSIERINNDGHYEPSNCKWATAEEQASNRRTNVLISFKGKTKTVKQWADEFGFSFAGMQKRIKNFPLEEALSFTRFKKGDH